MCVHECGLHKFVPEVYPFICNYTHINIYIICLHKALTVTQMKKVHPVISCP